MTETLLDTGKPTVYKSNRGMPFSIEAQSGLFYIKMNGQGVRPSLCDARYTGYRMAERVLVEYLKAGDKGLGEAEYPGRVPRERTIGPQLLKARQKDEAEKSATR